MSKYFFIVLYFFSSSTIAQNDYYVAPAPAGNNANSGSVNSPWETITFGVGQLSSGDVLNIKAGTYEEKIDIDVSGTAAAIITIKNYQNDEVILDAINSPNDLPIIYTNNAYLRIEGLHLTNNQTNNALGFFIEAPAHDIEIINNKVSNINFSTDANDAVNTNTNAVPLGVLGNNGTTAVHDISIIGNEVFNNRTGYSENITLGGNVDGFLVDGNTVHDNTNIGIDMTGNYGECPVAENDHPRNGTVKNNLAYNCLAPYGPSAGIYVDGGKDIVVENNTCHHNGYGGEIGCEENGETTNVTFRNNIFYQNTHTGMHIGAYDDQTTGNVVNAVVSNNTFYQNDTDNTFDGELILTLSDNTHIFDNIFYISAQNVYLYAERTQTDMVLDYNLVFNVDGESQIETTINGNTGYTGLQNFYNATGYGAHSTFGDPLFIDVTATPPDFHIPTNSPAKNAGDTGYTPTAGEVDMDGETRANGTVDCGADEYYAPLAVEYLSPLKGKAYEKYVELKWVTAYEENADYFEIERLLDDEWNALDVAAAGKQSYVAHDENPAQGINIYRLKQVDIFGAFSYSNIVSVNWVGERKPVKIYPNPSGGTFFIEAGHRSHWIIKIDNLLGENIFYARDVQSINNLPSGTFVVSIFDERGARIQCELLVVVHQ